MPFSREQKVAIVGIGIVFTGLTGMMTGVLLLPNDASARPIKEREDELAMQIGRPVMSHILEARTVLVRQPNSEIPNYYGDEVACAPTRRSMLRMVDAACGVLEVALAKKEEHSRLIAEDPVLKDLRSGISAQTETAREILLGGVGTVAGGAALFMGAIKLDDRQRRKQMMASDS